jgi:fructose-1,6-bisphosphatase/inositol monophosphatase family enzyme
VDDVALLEVLTEAAVAIRSALDGLTGWGPSGARPGQYRTDVVADAAAIAVLVGAGLGVLSEETGVHHADRPLFAVLDPVDGSTNASRSLPWYATSICVLDDHGPRVALVVNQGTGERFDAIRGGGARCDSRPIAPSDKTALAESLIGLSGYPRRHLGWRQYRALGAAALDLCAVASGRLDAYLDCTANAHGPWDYLGGVLVCMEAGAVVADVAGRALVTRGHADRRTPVAAGTPALLAELRQQVLGE